MTSVTQVSASVAMSSENGNEQAGSATRLEIYNFDHGFSSPRALHFGPYTIRVCNDQHTSQDVFRSSDRRTFASTLDDDVLKHTVTHLAATPGAWAVTAVVDDHPDLHAASVLFPQMPFMKGTDDLSLILWFLTGREVAIGANKQPQWPLCPADRLVSANYFYFPVLDWAGLSTVFTFNASDALHAICLALAAPDLLLKTSLSTGALDVLATKWYKRAKRNRYDDAVRVRCKVATEAFKQSFIEQGEAPAIADDVGSRIQGLLNDSAYAKVEAFLLHHGMITATADEATIFRVKLLNKHRNAIAHTAGILIDPRKLIETELQIAGAVSAVVLKICRVYIAKHLLGIQGDEYGVDKDEAYVREFFATGKLHGQDVFNETFKDYMRRVESQWVERGEIDA